jgi:hypothetical protein
VHRDGWFARQIPCVVITVHGHIQVRACSQPVIRRGSIVNNHQAILELIETYFEGIYTGNADSLRGVFHPAAQVADRALGQFRVRPVAEYISGVASRQSPQALGEARAMRALTVEVLDGVASVTARLEMLGQRYYNVLSLVRDDAGWRIVHKLFGNIEW